MAEQKRFLDLKKMVLGISVEIFATFLLMAFIFILGFVILRVVS